MTAGTTGVVGLRCCDRARRAWKEAGSRSERSRLLGDRGLAAEALVDVGVDLFEDFAVHSLPSSSILDCAVRRSDLSGGTSGIVDGCGQMSSSMADILTLTSFFVTLNTM